MAFKKYDIWDLIILQDTKQSFQIKLQNLYLRFLMSLMMLMIV